MDRRRPSSLSLSALALLTLGVGAACKREPSITLHVAVTGDLAPAFEALGAEFTRAEPVGLSYSFGASEALAQQMQQGAVANRDVFVTTDVAQVGRLVSLNRCEDLSRSFVGFATLVLVTAPGAPRADTIQSLTDPRYARLVIMHPERTPFGRAAVQVLNSLAIYDALAPRIVYVDTARQALDQLRAGAAQATIVPRVAVTEGDSLAVPADLYRPIEQVAVLCTRDPGRRDAAMRFLQYMREGEGKPILESYGFAFP